MPHQLEFRSALRASRAEAWDWITSVKGISTELRPILRMSVPRGVSGLPASGIEPGKPLFRSRIYLLGLLPVDYSDLTLIELKDGIGFVEQSPMGSMRLWRHERRIEAAEPGCAVTDVLTFQPRFASNLLKWFIQRLFTHRHAVLRRHLGNA
ncbi:MAG: hypothetical protein QM772_00195 [Ottowia sp.]|uniref:hypothetical protein n=1 Tax=Ottowia sp. TaxID=1898956 RepID=UPI0039E372F0